MNRASTQLKLAEHENVSNNMCRRFSVSLAFGIAATAWSAGAGNMSSSNKTPELKPPPLPPLRALKVEPGDLTLEDGLDARRVLVWGETDAKGRIDLTAQ